MDADMDQRLLRASLVLDGSVLWTRRLTCDAPLLYPSRKYKAACRNPVACFLRFYQNAARAAWRAYRASKQAN